MQNASAIEIDSQYLLHKSLVSTDIKDGRLKKRFVFIIHGINLTTLIYIMFGQITYIVIFHSTLLQ